MQTRTLEARGAAEPQYDNLLDQILEESKLVPTDDGYGSAREGMRAFLAELLRAEGRTPAVNSVAIDMMIAEIDAKISAQMDEILHDPQLMELESRWRGLKYLVDNTDFSQNIRIEMLNASKMDLASDFEDAIDITQSGLYKHVYTAEYGQFGGQPVAAVICDYEFGPGALDIKLAQSCASVGSMSHAPFIAGAAPSMLEVSSFSEIPNLKDVSAIFESPRFTKWNSFRETEDARYFGLVMPRFMLRAPYGPQSNPVRSFGYEERAQGRDADYLWGNAVYAFAGRLTESFAKYRWCPNIIGPQSGGAVQDLPIHNYEAMGQLQQKLPVEVLISDRREFELAELGFIALTMRKGSDNAAFFSANSVQKPKVFPGTPEGKLAEMNYKLSLQLPYMMVINRLAHYIKVLQREHIGSWKQAKEIEMELNNWLRQYISDQENPSADVRSRRPLRRAVITVSDVEGEPGWYRVGMMIQPHFKHMGADFTLSLTGKLDKN